MVFHPFHLVSLSPWPLLVGMGVVSVVIGLLDGIRMGSFVLFLGGLMGAGILVTLWWRDVVRESYLEGVHGMSVVSGLMVGMVLFILSEVLFFVSFFWAYFHSALSSAVDLGVGWPPEGVGGVSAFQVPLLNTMILLSSGASVTWAHQSILIGDKKGGGLSLMLTWLLGVYFLCLQYMEYYTAPFDISCSVFGSVFFMVTGFHGFHVMLGTGFLVVMWVRERSGHFSDKHHFGFEAAAWYWHFVDVVWLFLFCVVYWWGF